LILTARHAIAPWDQVPVNLSITARPLGAQKQKKNFLDADLLWPARIQVASA
jgi:hypothetical protein